MNLGEMRTALRRDLRDEDQAVYRWTDNALDRHILHAVKDFSESIPRQQKAVIATTPESRDISISSLSNRVDVEAVEYPAGRFPPCFQRFSLWDDTLTLLGDEMPDGANAIIYYGKTHTLDATTSTIPPVYEDMIAGGAAGYAAVEWAIYATNRVNIGGLPTPTEFLLWGREKLTHFRQDLRRLGGRHRVRARTLYIPYQTAVSAVTDYGP